MEVGYCTEGICGWDSWRLADRVFQQAPMGPYCVVHSNLGISGGQGPLSHVRDSASISIPNE